MIRTLATSKVSRFQLAAVAEQAGLNVTWSKIHEDTFSRDVAQVSHNTRTAFLGHGHKAIQIVKDKQKSNLKFRIKGFTERLLPHSTHIYPREMKTELIIIEIVNTKPTLFC